MSIYKHKHSRTISFKYKCKLSHHFSSTQSKWSRLFLVHWVTLMIYFSWKSSEVVRRALHLPSFLKKIDQFRLKIGGNIWRRREIMSNLGFPYLGSSYCGKNLCNWVQFTNSNYSVLPNIRKKSVMLCYHEQWL